MRAVNPEQADLGEVPNRLLRSWGKAYSENGGLGIDELAEISLLNGEQRNTLLTYSRYFGLDAINIYGNPPKNLRVYALLNTAQRKQAFAGGLRISSLMKEQYASIRDFLEQQMVDHTSAPPDAVGVWFGDIRSDKPGPQQPSMPEPTVIEMKIGSTTEGHHYVTSTPDGQLMPVGVDYPSASQVDLLMTEYDMVIHYSNGGCSRDQIFVTIRADKSQ